MKTSSALEKTFDSFKKFDPTFYASRVYQIAESNVLIFYHNKEIYELLSKAISHLEIKSDKINLTIYATNSEAYSHQVPQISDRLISQENKTSEEKQNIYFVENSNYKLSYQKQDKLIEVSLLDTLSNEAIFYLDNRQEHQTEVLASPFRNIFSWYFLRKNKVLLHASAVGNENGGIIFIGPGGSGKSSCSLMASKTKYKFAADDAVIVSEDLKAYSIYNTFRLHQDDLKKFNLDSKKGFCSQDKKFNYYINEISEVNLIKDFSLKAIVAPTLNQSKCGFESIKSIEALTILAPSSLMHIPGYGIEALKLLAKIANSTLTKYRYFINQDSRICEDLRSLIL